MAAPGPPADWPDRVAPMLARLGEGPFDSPDHLFEIKWDGIRCIARVSPERLSLHNRSGGEIAERYPEFVGLSKLPPFTMLDGEIIVLHDGKPSFPKALQRQHASDPRKIEMLARRLPATLMVFDALFVAGENIMTLPLVERRERLIGLGKALDDPHIVVTDHVLEQGKAYFEAAERFGLEGVIAKRLDSPYVTNRRTSHWVKVKVAKTGEFDIIGFTARGESGPVSALLLGMTHRGRLIYKGRVGSGFTEEQRQTLFDALVGRPVLEKPPAGGPRDAEWRCTDLRAQVKYLEKTTTGMLRGPVFVDLVAS